MTKQTRYRVTGTQAVDGHAPGDEYSATYSEAHERYLLEGGHVTLVKAHGNADADTDDTGDGDDGNDRGDAATTSDSKEQA